MALKFWSRARAPREVALGSGKAEMSTTAGAIYYTDNAGRNFKAQAPHRNGWTVSPRTFSSRPRKLSGGTVTLF